MKFQKIALACALTFSVATQAAELSTPSGYSKLKNGDGVDLYKSSDGGVYVQVVDLKSGARISFGGFADVASSSNKTYHREKLSTLYNEHYSSDLFSAINGQFYDNKSATTGVAFPIKSNGVIKADAVWDSLSKRTMMIDYYGNAYVQDGYNAANLKNQSIKELIVGLHPSVSKSKSITIGRSYMGGYSATCTPKWATCMFSHVVFFVAKDKSQSQMESIAAHWNVATEALVMMDGSGSSQIKAGSKSLYGNAGWSSNSPDYRTMPHVILTYEK
ncbi:MAG: hypothetical protein MJK04_03245 [Psychrosphaera sp.]|nr:hypothetical protein [Psychrosphaera sp.]